MFHKVKILQFALVGLVLVACASTPEPETQGTTIYFNPETGEASVDSDAPAEAQFAAKLLSQQAELSNEQIWNVDNSDNATHIQSGFQCPVKWSDFVRTSDPFIFNRNGTDVGCGYANSSGSILTLYAYKNGQPVEDELKRIMENIVKARIPINEESNIQILQMASIGMTYVADAIAYTEPNGTKMKSGVALADASGWRLKARVTYPQSEAENMESFIGVSLLGQFERIGGLARAVDQQLDTSSPRMPDGSELET